MANIDKAFDIRTLSLDERVLLTSLAVDPSVGLGFEAPTGSIVARDGTSIGEWYLKTGVLDTDWVQLAVLTDITDESVKVSANDTTPGFLNGKLVAGTGITLTENNDGANETLTVASSGSISGLAITTIGGQEILTLEDTTRANKVLSTTTMVYTFDKGQVKTNTWMAVSSATDANNGHNIPLNATIVGISGQAATGGGRTLDLYIDDVLNVTTIATFPAISDSRIGDMTLNVDVTAGQKLQIRGGSIGANTGKASVLLYIKWRG